jgi:hypothetical protein
MKHENENEKEKKSLLKPDFLDLDGDGNKEESMKKAAQDKEKMRKPKADGGPEAEKRVAARGPETEKRVADTYKIKNPNDFKAQMYLGFAGSDKFLRGKYLKEEKEEISEIRKEFNKAFREARNEGLETFMFRGDEYHTRLKEEMEEMREPKAEGGDPMKELKDMYADGGEMEMLPDEKMEEQFVDFVIDEALSDKEESMLMEQLEANPELSMIFDKVIEKASEFTGAGEVEGPGTGTSDSIPARLSDGEFVFTAKSVEQIGADNLMKMMKDAESAFDAGEDRKAMEHGGLHSTMDDDNMSDDTKRVEMTYNINRPESVSTVNPLLAKEEEEDLINQELKKGMLGNPNIRS